MTLAWPAAVKAAARSTDFLGYPLDGYGPYPPFSSAIKTAATTSVSIRASRGRPMTLVPEEMRRDPCRFRVAPFGLIRHTSKSQDTRSSPRLCRRPCGDGGPVRHWMAVYFVVKLNQVVSDFT